MRPWLFIGVLSLTACESAEPSLLAKKVPFVPQTVPTCRPSDDAPVACRPAAHTDDLPDGILEHADGPPAGWREPRITIPFGYFSPAACVETEEIPDLEQACSVEVHPANGRPERILRSADRVQRFLDGRLIEDIELDAAGRVLRRTFGDRTDRWQYRADGVVVDHRWAFRPDHEEREVRSCDGRMDQLVTNECNASPRQYHYDTADRLVRITQAMPNFDLLEAFVYDEFDRLRMHRFGEISTRHWDSQGRLIRETNGGSAVDGVRHHVYGPDGLERTWYFGHGNAEHTGLTEYRYDDGKLTLWWSVQDSWSGVSGRNHTTPEAHRLTYACAGGKVREEIDRTLDGEADIVLTWRRLSDGSVLETRTTAEGDMLEWTHYRFDCEQR